MSRTVTDLCSIGRAGAGLIIDAAQYSTTDLCSIARACVGTMTVKNTFNKTITELRSIARAARGRVVIEV